VSEQRIETLKHLHLTTVLGQGAEIVVPADPAWQAPADLSPHGEVLGAHRLSTGVTALTPLSLPTGPGLLVGTAGGLVTGLALRIGKRRTDRS